MGSLVIVLLVILLIVIVAPIVLLIRSNLTSKDKEYNEEDEELLTLLNNCRNCDRKTICRECVVYRKLEKIRQDAFNSGYGSVAGLSGMDKW